MDIKPIYTSTKQVNIAFRMHAKENNIEVRRGKPQNDQLTDTRMAYCDFIQSLHGNGLISDNLRQNAHYF